MPKDQLNTSVEKSNSSPKKKEYRFASKGILSFKELEECMVVEGYVATSHFDGQDIVPKETLERWATEINDGNPRSNKVSINHNREKHVAGVGIKGTAEVHELSDGHSGLFVKTRIDSSRDDYDKTKHRVENDFLDSFSIEYIASQESRQDDNGARILGVDTELHGWTLASQPMNENAVMIKEIVSSQASATKEEIKIEHKEVNKMTETITEEVPKVEVKEDTLMADKLKKLEAYEAKEKEAKHKVEMKEMVMEMLKSPELQKEALEIKSNDEPLIQTKEEPVVETKEKAPLSMEELEFKEMREGKKKLDIEEKFRRAGMFAEKVGMIEGKGDYIEYKKSTEKENKDGLQFKTFGTNGNKLEFKSLGITTNQNTDTDYLLSAAELSDVFDPVIYDTLNQSTTTYALLRKDDFSNKGNNQVQFVLRTGLPNQTAAFYTGNSVSTSQSTLLKVMTKFKKCQVGVSVDGEMIAAARGGPVGDVFALHVRYGTEDMLTVINSALFGITGAETSASPIGFEYIANSASYTDLYNIARNGDKDSASYNGLSPDSAGDTYINGSSARISLVNLRSAIEQAEKEGANLGNLVFITHPTQVKLFKGIYDASQRMMPVSTRFGFEGRPDFEGVPVFSDKDCNSDDWWLIDLDSHRMAVWVPPTLEMLGKRSDADEGFVKTYFATYNWNPRRLVMIYGNATS